MILSSLMPPTTLTFDVACFWSYSGDDLLELGQLVAGAPADPDRELRRRAFRCLVVAAPAGGERERDAASRTTTVATRLIRALLQSVAPSSLLVNFPNETILRRAVATKSSAIFAPTFR